MPHFFISSNTIVDNIVKIYNNELLKHLVKSLRVQTGETLKFFDENRISYLAKIESVDKNELLAEIIESSPSSRVLNFNISLMASIIKQEAWNELISGVTQLGIKNLFPVYSDNTTVSKAQIQNKTGKWQKISDEAVKQCERADFMKIYPFTSFDKFDFSKFDKIIVFSEIEKDYTLKKALKDYKFNSKDDKILIIVGPEGGFSNREFEFFKSKNFIQIKISELILKAQTACIAGLSNLICELSE